MKVCLASLDTGLLIPTCDVSICKYVLQSFYTATPTQMMLGKKADFFLLDSGAFTFMQSQKKGDGRKNIDFETYADQYIEFINKWDVDYYFELDIDDVVGIEEVERLRKKIEDGVGKPSIPVWHTTRGKDYFVKMCEQYDYVAVGGLVNGQYSRTNFRYLDWFINTAHEHGCKIHILGLTDMNALKRYHCDSADSTRWLGGGRFGELFYFDGKEVVQYRRNGRKLRPDITYKDINTHNFIEWCKFQKYAEYHL